MRTVPLLLVLLIGCVQPTAPDPTFFAPLHRPPVEGATRVNSLAELRAALTECRSWIAITGGIHFRSPADAIDLDALSQGCTHTLVIYGGGDWGSAQINRLASFPEPLIRAAHSRDWEIHFVGLLFDGWGHIGPALHLEYVQLSTIERMTIARFRGPAPLQIDYASTLEIRDSRLDWNESPGQIGGQDIRWRGGALHSNWNGMDSGLEIVCEPHNPPSSIGGPVLVERIRQEGADVTVRGCHGVMVAAGYMLAANIAVRESSDVLVTCGGGYAYTVTVNNRSVCQ